MAKIALITGATAGIGEATAHIFARERYNVILTGRRLDRLEKLAAHINKEYNVEVAICAFDGDETNIVGIDVGIIVWWNGDGDLELAGKVGGAVKGFVVNYGIAGDLCFFIGFIG